MEKNLLISVCICTYRRPSGLEECLRSIWRQEVSVPFEVVVVDDDPRQGAAVCAAMMQPLFAQKNVPFTYLRAGHRNIALARNAAVAQSHGSLIAFIDDDEKADPCWLECLATTLRTYGADAVIGSVIPLFPDGFPDWIRRSGIFHRPCPPTGVRLQSRDCRTGNVLARREMFATPFEAQLGRIGGEDTLLFRQMERAGAVIRSCAEAVVYETQEVCRCSLQWQIRREYRGGWLYSFIRQREAGAPRALVAALRSCVLGSARVIVKAFLRLYDPRTAILILVRGVALQSGKLAFFAFHPVEEYKERP
jgi:succinoglycan biosynthesis protein ExoM